MLKKGLSVGVVVLFLSISVIPYVVSDATTNGIIYVDDDADPGWYDATHVKTIKEGINNASSGDTVYVYSGTYDERIKINKQLFIKGIKQSNQSKPLIEGCSRYDAVIINADGCSFENFRVINEPTGYLQKGITLNSSFNVIQNCYTSKTGWGLYLVSSSNNYICNNEMDGGSKGFQITGKSQNNIFIDNYIHGHSEEIAISSNTHNNSFYNNTISNGGTGNGVNLGSSSDICFINNTISSNNVYGIYSSYTMNLTLLNNKFIKNGVRIKGNLTHFTSHKIEGNTVNGKPLYYYVNRDNFIMPSDGGQVIIRYCKNGTIKNLNISKTDIGIDVGHSSDITISDNSISKTRWEPGIRISHSSNIIISNNSISDCDNGIFLSSSDYNIISGNTIKDDGDVGIKLSSSSHNKIHRNNVSNSRAGIHISGIDNIISENVVFCKEEGIIIDCSICMIWGNTISANQIGIFIWSSFNSFYDNNFIANLEHDVFIELEGSFLNKWKHNYWDKPRLAPKPIFRIYWVTIGLFPHEGMYIPIPILNFDMRPRLTPYVIQY